MVLDIGNTRAKLGLFNGVTLEKSIVCDHNDVGKELGHLSVYNCIVSNVHGLKIDLPKVEGELIELSESTSLPITVDYETPESLGADRIAGAAGAAALYNHDSIAIIDAGTCITIDVLVANTFIGGIITPGISMRLQSMHTFTGNLPLIDFTDQNFEEVGKSTKSCMEAGAIGGVLHEVRGVLSAWNQQFADLQVVITGGNAKFFEKKLEINTFVVPNLVLYGLNSILQHNVAN